MSWQYRTWCARCSGDQGWRDSPYNTGRLGQAETRFQRGRFNHGRYVASCHDVNHTCLTIVPVTHAKPHCHACHVCWTTLACQSHIPVHIAIVVENTGSYCHFTEAEPCLCASYSCWTTLPWQAYVHAELYCPTGNIHWRTSPHKSTLNHITMPMTYAEPHDHANHTYTEPLHHASDTCWTTWSC